MAKQLSPFMQRLLADEDRYGDVANIPAAELEAVRNLATDTGEALAPDEHDALVYMVKRGDISFTAMWMNLGRSAAWLKAHLPAIEKEVGINHDSKSN